LFFIFLYKFQLSPRWHVFCDHLNGQQ
jgi:hypothetical protein